jgi:GWxTD domain-containing protein
MRYILILFLGISLSAQSQALRDLNLRYLYNPLEPFTFELKAVRTTAGWLAAYELRVTDTATAKAEDFFVQWSIRNSINDKEGRTIGTDSVSKTISGASGITGKINIAPSSQSQVLVTKILNNTLKRAWFFYKILEPNFPIDGYLSTGSAPLIRTYVKVNTPVTFEGQDSRIVSYYNDNFPPAAPAFSESLGKVSKGITVDSTFTISSEERLEFTKKGLYLVQKDTNTTQGFTFRVEDDYPRLSKVESLAGPLIYVCTKQEFEKIRQAKGEKKVFDKVILGITGDAGRAKTFIKNYFRRVELANQYFSSYKEGWKTDRGMIYIVFGIPDEVFKFVDREVWNYKNQSYKASFEFVKSSTLFDPDNFVLIRSNKFQQTWYEVIDLWRNARF